MAAAATSKLAGGRQVLRRAARSVAVRTGKLERLRSLRSAVELARDRGLSDHFATRVAMAAALRQGSNAIDVGANVGGVLAEIARLAPEGRHLAYEPLPELHADLERRFPQVEVRCAALSDEAGTSTFSRVVGNPEYSGLRLRGDRPPEAREVEEITVRTERLDDAIPDDLEPDLIKVDVEGAEVKVLEGARETLARYRPIVFFEHGEGGADLYGTTSGQLWDLLHDCGLRVFNVHGEGPFSQGQFEALFEAPQWNYMAVPR